MCGVRFRRRERGDSFPGMKPVHWIVVPAALLWLAGCGDSQASSVAGTYVIDTEAFRAEMQKQMAEVPAAEKAMAENMMKPMLDALGKAEVTIKADHTWTGSSEMMGKKQVSEGTWQLQGSELTMTTTKEDGVAVSKEGGEIKKGTWKDGKIHVTEKQGDQTMTMVFKKK